MLYKEWSVKTFRVPFVLEPGKNGEVALFIHKNARMTNITPQVDPFTGDMLYHVTYDHSQVE